MVWDSSFKNMLKQLLGKAGISVITETEVATSNQRIDFVIPNNDQTINSPFRHAKKLIIGEFKSENDKLFNGDLLMLLSKAFSYIAPTHGYGNKKSELEKINVSDVSCILFLGGKKSVKSLSFLGLNINEIEKGVYECSGTLLHLLIIEIDNIQLSREYEALKIFATEKIREKTLKAAIRSDNIFINSVAYFLYKEELMSLAEAEGKPISSESLSIRSAVETIGLSRVLEEVGLSKVIEKVGLSKVIEEVGLSKVFEEVGLSKVIEEVGLSKVIEEVGLSKVFEEVGLSKVIEEVGLENLVNSLSEGDKHTLRKLLDS